jgi:signal transduction histidine kinase
MTILALRGLGLFIVAILNFILVFFLWQRAKDGRKDIFYLSISALFSGFYAFSCAGTYFFWNPDSFSSVIWYRTTWLGVLLLPPFVIFSYYFTKQLNHIKLKIFLLYFIALVISFLALTTKLFVKAVYLTYPNISALAGPLDQLGRLFILSCVVIVLVNLVREYIKSTGFVKLQIRYFILGTFLFGISGIILTAIIPFIRGESPYYDILAYFELIWVGLMSFAILRYRLFEIKVVLTVLLVALIALLLFFQIFFVQNTLLLIIDITIFLVFLFLGNLLIRSVMREIRLREELEKAYFELEKLDKAKSEFISIASHQLRTPLTAIKGYISMMIEGSYGKISGLLKGKLTNVAESTERLIRLINSLLSVSRIESGKIEYNFEKNSLEHVIQGVIDILTLEARRKKIVLKWEKPEKPLPELLIDSDKIKDVILNLVDNAIKYTQEGSIHIKSQIKENFILTTITDTGSGMTEEEKEKLFQSFSRGTAGNEYYTEGSGLGLYIAKKFVEKHNGKIWVESEGRGKGSTFYMELPVVV